MKHFGDITKINGADVPIVDIVTGGSPCQDLSVAGKRAGLAGERSGLFMEQIRIIKEMREHDRANGRTNECVRPRFMVWENVPGAFSSNKGEDFRAVLEETAKVADSNAVIPEPPKGKWTHAGCIMGDGWSIAWRVHDAQFWGVPQRRKRISLVADFGGATAPEILFERKGLSGDTAESREEGQGAAADVGSGIEETGRAVSFQERAGKPGGGKGILIQNERTGALSTLNNQSVVYGMSAYDSNSMKSSNPHSGIYEADTTRTLDNNGGNPACNQGGMIVLEGNGSRPSHQGDGYAESEVSYTLNAVEHHAVAYRGDAITSPINASNPKPGDPCHTLTDDSRNYVVLENHPADSRVKISEDGKVQTLSGRMGTGGNNVPMVMEEPLSIGHDIRSARFTDDGITDPLTATDYKDPIKITYQKVTGTVDCGLTKGTGNRLANSNMFVSNGAIVRRLTPLECERLQGFPVVRKVRFTEMTKDEYIAWNINEGNIVVDTEYGKVFATRGPGGIKLDEPRELMGTILNGYRVVSIRNGDTKMQCRVHRIVWIAERGVIPDGYVIDHINNDKQDNRLCNLQLLTAAENSTKARADGLYKIHDDSGSAKITDEVHDFIQYVYGNTDLSIRQLAEFFGISKSRVQQIIHDEPWTDIGDWVDSKGKKHKGESDSPRYKALGNSIALPFWKWMAKRMRKYLGENPTMASLFDGIGGFPLSYSEAGVEPVWASEIEEFPIAVTKKRFSEGET